MRINKAELSNSRYLFAYMLIIISCFFPAYLCQTNMQNLSFTMAEIPLFLYVLFDSRLLLLKRKKNRLYLFLILAYFGIFLYQCNASLECYWALAFKSCTFLFVWILFQLNEKYGAKEDYFLKLENCIIFFFTLSVLISLAGYVVGLEAIHLDLANIAPRAQGVYSDSRLTWVFMHKSTYGVLLVAVFAMVLKKENLKYRKYILLLYSAALILVNSAVSIIAAAVVVFAYYIKRNALTTSYVLKVLMTIVLGACACFAGYYFLSANRDISSLGNRLNIWGLVPEAFSLYPDGMGLDFYTEKIWSANIGFSVNNLHNVALNECLHYSIPVGILFFSLVLYVPFHYIRLSESRDSYIILMIGMILPMMFDQALNDIILPLYMLILFLCFRPHAYD